MHIIIFYSCMYNCMYNSCMYNLSSLIHGPCFDSVSFQGHHLGAEKVFHFKVLVSFQGVAFQGPGVYSINML